MEDETKADPLTSHEREDRERSSERSSVWPPPPPRREEPDPGATQAMPRPNFDRPSHDRPPPRPWEPAPRPAQPAPPSPVGNAPVRPREDDTQVWRPTPKPPAAETPTRATPAPPPPARTTPARTEERKPPVQVRRLRRGRLAIRKIDPWAVLKLSLVFYFCMLLIVMLALAIIFTALRTFGVIANIETLLQDLEFEVSITGGFLFRWVFLLGLVGTLIASALTMFMAFLYNLIADVVGGVELLVTERE